MLDFDVFEVLSFDCYGTLVDWEAGILATLKPVLDHHHIILPNEKILTLYAECEAKVEQGDFVNYRTVLRRVMQGLGEQLGFIPSPAEACALEASIAQWPVFEDTIASLKKLSARYSLVVLSNIDDDLFAGTASHLGVSFARVITAQQIGSYKPALKNFEYAIQQIGRPRNRILHVAQSLYHDIRPARLAGLKTVWVNRRKGKAGSGATVPAHALPDLEIPDLRTLADMIDQ